MLGIIIALMGYGFIAFVIIYAHKKRKKELKIIFDRIRSRKKVIKIQ